MTKKKKEIILEDLEIITPDVEWKMGMDSLKAMAEDEQKQKKEAFETPVKYLKSDLIEIAMFINILIKRLDPEYHDVNNFPDCEEWDGADIFKDIQVKYTGDEKSKEFTLFCISDYLTSLDYVHAWRLYENESLERKSGNQKEILDKYIKRHNKKFNKFCKESKYHQEHYREPESEDN